MPLTCMGGKVYPQIEPLFFFDGHFFFDFGRNAKELQESCKLAGLRRIQSIVHRPAAFFFLSVLLQRND